MGNHGGEQAATGRPRDASIDDAVLDATLHRLARDGFAGLSLASIAADAGTSRPAIYRRWPDKESLVVGALARLAQVEPPDTDASPFDDLVAELEHFRHCITEAAALPVAGLMLGDDVNETLRAKYHDLVVVPRRTRIHACLQRAIDDGALDADADLVVAGTFLTGSWYAFALAGGLCIRPGWVWGLVVGPGFERCARLRTRRVGCRRIRRGGAGS
jgi:AcrR family transcriptional regulator